MNDYKVTRIVTSFGYYVGLGLIGLVALAGAFSNGFMGFLMGAVAGIVLCVPFLMMCEGMHALVTIAKNTQTKNAGDKSFEKGA